MPAAKVLPVQTAATVPAFEITSSFERVHCRKKRAIDTVSFDDSIVGGLPVPQPCIAAHDDEMSPNSVAHANDQAWQNQQQEPSPLYVIQKHHQRGKEVRVNKAQTFEHYCSGIDFDDMSVSSSASSMSSTTSATARKSAFDHPRPKIVLPPPPRQPQQQQYDSPFCTFGQSLSETAAPLLGIFCCVGEIFEETQQQPQPQRHQQQQQQEEQEHREQEDDDIRGTSPSSFGAGANANANNKNRTTSSSSKSRQKHSELTSVFTNPGACYVIHEKDTVSPIFRAGATDSHQTVSTSEMRDAVMTTSIAAGAAASQLRGHHPYQYVNRC